MLFQTIQPSRYAKFVEWSDEDQCFIGRCPELTLGGVHGSDEEAKVYAELCEVVEEWIELLHRAGVPLPEPLAAKSSVANSCCALSRPFTAASRPKLLPPVKA